MGPCNLTHSLMALILSKCASAAGSDLGSPWMSLNSLKTKLEKHFINNLLPLYRNCLALLVRALFHVVS